MQEIQTLYHSVTGPLIEGLIEQLVFFGTFTTCLVFVRRSLLDPGWARSADCLRNIALLLSVTLFTLYIGLTYEIENFNGLQGTGSDTKRIETIETIIQLDSNSWNRSKILLLTILPIDLIGIILNSALYALLIWNSVNSKNWTGRNFATLRMTINLFSIASAWHLTMATWWIIYTSFSNSLGEIFANTSIAFHLTIAIFDLLVAVSAHKLSKSERKRDLLTTITTGLTIIFFSYFLLLYSIRLWSYCDRFRDVINSNTP